MKTITSLSNPEIKEIAKLDSAKERERQQRFIAEGIRTVKTFIEAGYTPIQLYATEEMVAHIQEYADDDSITLVTPEILRKISQTTTPSGIVGVFKIPAQPAATTLSSGIVLAQLTDPGNIGTLIRTCAAMGKKTVVVIESADVWNPKVIQASAGTIALVTIFTWSWQELIKNKKDLALYGLVAQGGQPLQGSFKEGLLVVGSEAHGIPQVWLTDCDKLITLAMPGGTESLNAAVAGSIAMYLAWATEH